MGEIANTPHLWIPAHLKAAQKRISVVFYVHHQTRRILVGFPEQFPAPEGFIKVIATTAREVDQMSQKMREQDARDEAMTEEQREAIEGPVRSYVRQELQNRMANARNDINREFCRFALARLDEQDRKRRMKRESYMHCEAVEDGK